jgi:hypothetical protein
VTLQAELSIRLDATALSASLTAELGAATGDLQSVPLAVSAEGLGGASGAAASIDVSGLAGAAGSVSGDLQRLLGALPVADDLIAPLRAGIAGIDRAVSANLESDLRGALERIAAEFDAMEAEGGLGAMRRLAESLQKAPELAAVRDAVNGLLRVAGGRDLPAASLGELIGSVLSMLEAIGQMMTLETMLAEARRLGALVPAQLPEGRVTALLAGFEASVAAAEAQLTGLDTASEAQVDQAIEALVGVRAALRALIEALRAGMAFGEATLTLVDPAALVARCEAALERLRGVAVGDIEVALGHVADKLSPLLAVDLSGAPQFALESLLDQLEARSQDLADELATLDLGPLTGPFSEGLGSITAVADDVQGALDGVLTAVEDALGQVRSAVAALPLDQVANAVRDVVGVIAGVLSQLGDLLGTAQAAIGDAAGAAQAALARDEAAVDAFRDQLEDAFRQAKAFVDGLGLEAAIGEVADSIQTVSVLIGQADMAPYFATAQDAIDTTTGIIEKVPFPLLPDSMEQEVVDLVRPIKIADLGAFRVEILQVLQIEEDGTFALRPDLEGAVAGVQTKLDELLAALDGLHPRQLAGEINGALEAVRTEIEAVAPQIELGPITEALDSAKAAIAGLDLDAMLQPLTDGFDEVLAAVDRLQPGALIAPVDAEIDLVRQKLLDLTRLEQWREKLDEVRAEALGLVDLVDPAQLEEPLREAFADVQRRIGEGDLSDPLGPVGGIVAALLAGAGEAVAPEAIERVSAWVRGRTGGGAQLSTLSADLRAAIAETRRVVATVDPGALERTISADTGRLRTLVEALPAGAARDRLAHAVDAVDLSAELRLIAPNHQRYLDVLARSEAAAGSLAAKGFGEVDTVTGVLRGAVQPLMPLIATPREALGRLGFKRLDAGLPGLLGELFEVATPERLAGLLTPVFAALHGRATALLDGFIQPVRDLIDSLIAIVNSFDLGRLTEALDGVHAAARAEIAAFHPDNLLGDAKNAFTDAQAAITAFDPLGPVVETLETLKATILRVLAKLDGEALLATPIEIFETIVSALRALDLNGLLGPLYARLDAIAGQVAEGLDGTVTSFGRLQDALPAKVGSTSIGVSVSVSASVGG